MESFWQGKRVLVTGHTGFKGAWLALWLRRLGAEVYGYSLAPPSEPSLFVAARVEDAVTHVHSDLRDAERLEACFAEHRPEVVLHLAAQALVRRGYRRPAETFDTNLMGTVRLLDAVRATPSVRATVVVTSDKCYENREWPWGYRESDRLGGRDPYAASKACAELAVVAYRRSFPPTGGGRGMAVATVRAGNVIGGGDWGEDRLVPDVMRALAAGARPQIRSPAAVRPWQHVLEPLAGYLRLAEKLFGGDDRWADGWNFGPAEHDARPVAWVADRLCATWGEGAGWDGPHQGGGQTGPHEARLLKVDATRAREELGWAPRLGLERALEWVVEWHRAHAAGDDVRAVTEEQVARYQALG